MKAFTNQIKESIQSNLMDSQQIKFISERQISNFTQYDFVIIEYGLIRAVVSFHYENCLIGLKLWQFVTLDSFFPEHLYNSIQKGIEMFNDGGVQ